MILKKIEPVHFGPFTTGTSLTFDPEVTVLTGPNDTGKSSILWLLRTIFRQEKLPERYYNQFRVGAIRDSWEKDPELGAILTVELTERSKTHFALPNPDAIKAGDSLKLHYKLAPAVRGVDSLELSRNGARVPSVAPNPNKPPATIWLPPESEIRDVVDLSKMTPAEERLLKLGFGTNFTYAHFVSFSKVKRSQQIAAAKTRSTSDSPRSCLRV